LGCDFNRSLPHPHEPALEMIQVGRGEGRNLGVTLGDIRQLSVAV
jgi:hypothetical protein